MNGMIVTVITKVTVEPAAPRIPSHRSANKVVVEVLSEKTGPGQQVCSEGIRHPPRRLIDLGVDLGRGAGGGVEGGRRNTGHGDTPLMGSSNECGVNLWRRRDIFNDCMV